MRLNTDHQMQYSNRDTELSNLTYTQINRKDVRKDKTAFRGDGFESTGQGKRNALEGSQLFITPFLVERKGAQTEQPYSTTLSKVNFN